MFKIIAIASILVTAYAACGTTGGSGCETCTNDPEYCCYDCGPEPCAGSDGNCYSCSGSDGYCYPYYCGSYCSTGPCMKEGEFENAMNTVVRSAPIGKKPEAGKTFPPAVLDEQALVSSNASQYN